MILAAGEGRRMLPLTEALPKPLLQAGGKPLIVHQINKLAEAGFHDLVVNHAHLGARLEAALGDGQELGVRIQWSREGRPLETAGGIIRALPLLGDAPFVVVNGDIWTDYSYSGLRKARVDGERCLAHLVLVANPAHHLRGDFVLTDAGLLALPDDRPGAALTFSGIAVYHPAFFAGAAPGSRPLLPLLQQAIRQGQVSGEYHAGDWFDIGTPERLLALDERLRERRAIHPPGNREA